MIRLFSTKGKILPLLMLAVFCSSCLKQLSPTGAMSNPKIAKATKVEDLLGYRDQGLPGTTVEVPAVAPREGAGAVVLTLREAVLMGLEHNRNFQVERLKPAISRSAEEVERAAFDPVLSGTVSRTDGQGRATATTGTGVPLTATRLSTNDAETTQTGLGLRQATPLGATVELSADEARQSIDDSHDSKVRQRDWDLTITQSLLQGRGPEVSLARLRQSRLDTEISLYELQGSAETLVAQIEQGYWDLILAERSLAIYQQSLAIATRQVEEVNERIKIGALAESEAAAAEAEAAGRYQQLVAAKATLAKARLTLLRLLNPGGQVDWQSEIKLAEAPEMPAIEIDTVENHVAVALGKRPDLNQARLLVRRQDLAVTQTRNGLLPKLDLFISLGGSRYTSSFSDQKDELDKATTYTGGLTLELPLGNRAAKARHAAAGWSLNQAGAALANMEQLVQVDVRSAYVDVEQAAAQVKAARATAALRQKTLDLEQEKFRLGRSTTLLVAQAQRDLVGSRIAEAEAVVGVRKAILELYRLEGSLLSHRGIGA